MGYIVTNPDGLQFGHLGKAFRCGATLGEGQLSSDLIERLLAEGAIRRNARALKEPPGTPEAAIEVQQQPAATQSAVAFAAAHDLDLDAITGSGRGGKITLADVRAAVEASDGTE